MIEEKIETKNYETVYKLKKIQRAVGEKSAYEVYVLSLLFEIRALKEFSETYLKSADYIPLKEIAKECIEQYEAAETASKELLCAVGNVKDMPNKAYLKKREKILKKQNEFLNSVCNEKSLDKSYFLFLKGISRFLNKLCLISDKYCAKPNIFQYTDKLRQLYIPKKEKLKYLSQVIK